MIALAGRDMTGPPPYDREVNTVFQDYALFPHMTVGENIEYGMRVAKVSAIGAPTRAAEALEMVRLAGYEARKPGSSRADSASGWRSPGRSSTGRASCCSTSRSGRSI